jgi:hypothetical protein
MIPRAAASFDAEPVLLYGDHQAGGWAVIRLRNGNPPPSG